MKKLLLGAVTHEVTVTRIRGRGYGVRVLVNGEVNQEELAPTRQDIGRVARSMLRMEDKCGNFSSFAHSARHRSGLKEQSRRLEEQAQGGADSVGEPQRQDTPRG